MIVIQVVRIVIQVVMIVIQVVMIVIQVLEQGLIQVVRIVRRVATTLERKSNATNEREENTLRSKRAWVTVL